MKQTFLNCTKKTILTFNLVQSKPQNPRNILLHLSFSSLPVTTPPPDLVNTLSRILSDYRSPHHDIVTALNPFAPNISPTSVHHVLKRCNKLGYSAHRFFVWAQSLPGFRHEEESFRVLVSILGSSKKFNLLWDFLGEVKKTGVYEINAGVFVIVFRAYCKAGLPGDAIGAYNKMVDYGIKPDIYVADQLMFSLCRFKHVKYAQEFFDQVRSDFVVKAKSYSILMDGWVKIGQMDEARRLYDQMIERGCSPDLGTFNSVMDCLCKEGNVEDARKLFGEMESLGLKPDVDTYSVFIHAYCEADDIDSVYETLDEMKRCSLVPSVLTYYIIIKNLCKSARTDDAYDLLSKMSENGVEPDVNCYNIILAFHAERSEDKGVLRLMLRMDIDSCEPNGQTYNIVLKFFIRIKKFESMVEEIWNTMGKRGFYPSVSTYAVIVHGFLRQKRKALEAYKYFEIMIDEGIPPYTSTCNLLRFKLMKLGFSSQIDILAEKMERSTSRAIQELSSIMRVNSTSVESHNEDLANGSDYSD